MKKIVFKLGKIIYDEFHIDFSKPFSEQLDSLTEDLLQIEYENGYLIDLGWYPEFDENGKFTLQLIKNGDWRNPAYKKSFRDCKQLEKNLLYVINILEKWIIVFWINKMKLITVSHIPINNKTRMLPYCKKLFKHLMSAKHEFSVKADPRGVVSQSETLVPLRVRLSESVFLAIG